MKIGFIAEGSLSVPAVHFLAEAEALSALAFGYADPAVQGGAEAFCQARNIPFRGWTRGGLLEQVSEWVADQKPDLVLTLGFPSKIPPNLLRVPPCGFWNIHTAPLPAYQGPQPVFWQIRNGETQGGLTLHRMEEGFDTGPVLLEGKVPLGPQDTHGLHVQALSQAIPGLLKVLVSTLQIEGDAFLGRAVPQGTGRWWPRPGLADVSIDWARMTAVQVKDLVRACNPWNSGAWTSLQGQPCRVVAASLASVAAPTVPHGSVYFTEDGGLAAACTDGAGLALEILRLEEGLFTGARLRGMGIGPGVRFD